MTRPDIVALTLRNELLPLLKTLNDSGTPIDTGGGLGSEDLHLRYQGNRIHIQIHWPQEADAQ